MSKNELYDVAIIGAGIMGSATARELTRWDVRVCVIDKASDVAAETTRANSGIVHAGFDAKHGTLKAKYNVLGSKLYPQLAQELGFEYRNNGSLVLAFTDEEMDSIAALLENGRANGVEGLRIVDADELREIEPNVSAEARAALFAPTGAICNPYGATVACAENAVANGAEFLFNREVTAIDALDGGGFVLQMRDTLSGEEISMQTRAVLNAAGIFADRIGALAGCSLPSITARRGEYLILDRREGTRFSCTMFRAPSKVGKGVLVSPTVDGNLIVGPNAHAIDRFSGGRMVDTTEEGIDEVVCKARDIWPDLAVGAAIARFAGLRATPENGDFTIGQSSEVPGFFSASGIESPGLTAAPAIAVDLAAEIAASLGLAANADFNPKRERPLRYTELSEEKRAQLVAEDPAWGRMVCRCEQVTEAEIRAAINAPIPAYTLDSIKWRTRAGMGRCHGGFCNPYVARIISQETGCSIDQVRKGSADTWACAKDGARKNGPDEQIAQLAQEKGAQAAEERDIVRIDTDLAVVGGGAGGIASALAAREAGVENVLLVDREGDLGGILKQCIHPGFGLKRFSAELTGPEYADRDEHDLAASDVQVMKRTTAVSLETCGDDPAQGYRISAVGPQGAYDIHARSVVLATGSRERSAGQIDLNGDRPAGVYTAGCAQHFVNLMGTLPGREVVIYGSGDIGLIMARRLFWEGAHVKAVVERAKRPKGLRRNVKQCLEDCGIPLLLSQSVVRVFGKERVEGVEIVHTDPETKRPIPGTEYRMDCDTLLLSCGLIPEQDLLVEAGGLPIERGSCQTTLPGVFLCGNASQIHDIVDSVTVEGVYVGQCAAAYVLGEPEPEPIEREDEGAAAVATAEIFDSLPEGTEHITCICCPKGCEMLVSDASTAPADLSPKQRKLHIIEDWYVQNNLCPRGLNYALEEKTSPMRTLTSTVRAANRLEPVSVRTDTTIPKTKIEECLAVLESVVVEPPLAVGDVIVPDVCGTGANIVATKPLR